jgi:signal transduction histidine kinase
MRLAEFILRDMEHILTEWEAFAATHLPAAARMNSPALRDHAPEILRAIVLDLNTSQTPYEQDRKAKGGVPPLRDAANTAAQTHAMMRAEAGFSIVQMASEYRALRASVLKLWTAASRGPDTDLIAAMEDARRFNEAIDQALMESVTFFTQEVERTRNLFLAVVGHDLRNPLDTILKNVEYLSKLRIEGVVSEVLGRLTRSGVRIKHLLDDLLDFNRAALGKGVSINVADVELAQVCALEIEDLQSAHRDRMIRFSATGNLRGVWDAARIQQLLSNLLKNAIDHGAPDEAIEVRATGTEREVALSVHNRGAAIPQATLTQLFEPLKRGDSGGDRRRSNAHLGLGLFIAREIARAHGGSIHASSDERETIFTLHLPRSI